MGLEVAPELGGLKCPKCGVPAIAGARFCGSCGASLDGLAFAGGYPIRFEVDYAGRLSRLMIFVKWILAFPHYVILLFLGLAWFAVTIVAFFAILFTGRYPRGLFDFVVGIWRWYANVAAYVGLLRDEYPPFSLEPNKYPVTLEVAYPEELNRWLIFVKWILVIPFAIVGQVLVFGIYLLFIPMWFAVLINGRMPRIFHDYWVGAGRWYARSYAYPYLLTDEYPPWTMETSREATILAWIVGPIAAVVYVGLQIATS
jgi:hypothetical protein